MHVALIRLVKRLTRTYHAGHGVKVSQLTFSLRNLFLLLSRYLPTQYSNKVYYLFGRILSYDGRNTLIKQTCTPVCRWLTCNRQELAQL